MSSGAFCGLSKREEEVEEVEEAQHDKKKDEEELGEKRWNAEMKK